MSVMRLHHESDFTVVSNTILKDDRLSLKTIGLFVKVLSLPSNWDFSEVGLANICKDGITTIRSALHELESYGYLKRTKIYVKGKISDIEYDFYENPGSN